MPTESPQIPVQSPNPLSEAKFDNLTELFDRLAHMLTTDPAKLAEVDLDAGIAELRRQRELWTRADAAPKPPKVASARAKSLISSQTTEDLGL